jgi:hypothetical protein
VCGARPIRQLCSHFVSIAEVGKRRRSRRPRVNSPSPPPGSSSSLREQREGRKSAGSRPAAAKLRERWRAPSAKAVKGALVDGRRLGSGIPLLLTRGRWKRSWLFAGAQQWALAGRDRGRQRSDRRPSARLITPCQGGSACARSLSPPLIESRRETGGSSEAGGAPSSAAPPGVGLPQGGLTPRSGWHGAHALGSSRRRTSRRKPRARESGEVRVLVSECRLQRSVRSIFPVPSR